MIVVGTPWAWFIDDSKIRRYAQRKASLRQALGYIILRGCDYLTEYSVQHQNNELDYLHCLWADQRSYESLSSHVKHGISFTTLTEQPL